MESNESARDLLREADRAEAAPWVDFPPTPAWYPASVGIWGAALTLILIVMLLNLLARGIARASRLKEK